MQFVPTNATHMMTIPGIIRVELGTTSPFAFGRKLNGSNVMVGKVHSGYGYFGHYYATGNNEFVYRTDYEVLVCPCTNLDPGTPIPSGCGNPVRLYDSNCVYRKTACTIAIVFNQTYQTAYCQSKGMKKYAILSDVDSDSLETYVRTSGLSGGTYGVNGVSDNGTWFVYNPYPQPLWSGISVSGSGCLAMTVAGGPRLSFKAVNCTALSNSVCEFY